MHIYSFSKIKKRLYLLIVLSISSQIHLIFIYSYYYSKKPTDRPTDRHAGMSKIKKSLYIYQFYMYFKSNAHVTGSKKFFVTISPNPCPNFFSDNLGQNILGQAQKTEQYGQIWTNTPPPLINVV